MAMILMSSNWIGLVEIMILGATLLTTVCLSLFIALQAKRHFQLQHAKEFIARFNAAEMVRVRDAVDRWLNENQDPRILVGADGGEAAIAMRTFINFFQELGVAWKHGTVHREYTWDLFGGLIQRYWAELAPYCEAHRASSGRQALYRDFERLVGQMAAMDGHRGVVGRAVGGTEEVYLFGYGSLISPDSVARTLGREPDGRRLKPVWLNGYERGWTVHDMVRFEGAAEPRPVSFLNISPHPGRRCNGIAVPVHAADLDGFDRRERCYRRVDVSAQITPALDKPVHAYVGCEPWTNMPQSTVVAAKYDALVTGALGRWGRGFVEDYQASTLPLAWPKVEGDYEFVPHPPSERG